MNVITRALRAVFLLSGNRRAGNFKTCFKSHERLTRFRCRRCRQNKINDEKILLIVGIVAILAIIYAVAWIFQPAKNYAKIESLGGPGTYVNAYSINHAGQVVGLYTTKKTNINGEQRPFIWDKETGMIDLGTLGGDAAIAFSINDAGQVVGTSTLKKGNLEEWDMFLWTKKTGMIALGIQCKEPGFLLINSRGRIVGSCVRKNGNRQQFLWTKEAGMKEITEKEFMQFELDIMEEQRAGTNLAAKTFDNFQVKAPFWIKAWWDVGQYLGIPYEYTANGNGYNLQYGESYFFESREAHAEFRKDFDSRNK